MTEPTRDESVVYDSEYDPIFDPYLRSIGLVATAWAEFEFDINNAIWELANIERMAGACITAQLIGPGPRFRCLIALLHLRNTPDHLIKEYNSLSSEADGLGTTTKSLCS